MALVQQRIINSYVNVWCHLLVTSVTFMKNQYEIALVSCLLQVPKVTMKFQDGVSCMLTFVGWFVPEAIFLPILSILERADHDDWCVKMTWCQCYSFGKQCSSKCPSLNFDSWASIQQESQPPTQLLTGWVLTNSFWLLAWVCKCLTHSTIVLSCKSLLGLMWYVKNIFLTSIKMNRHLQSWV